MGQVNDDNRSFSHDVMTAIVGVPKQRDGSHIGVQGFPLGIELHFYTNTFFCFNEPIWPLVT